MKDYRQGRFSLLCVISLFLAFGISAHAAVAPGLVKGKVKDASGQPLVGVTVRAGDTNNITATDLDGNYSLNVEDADVVEFSMLGYMTQKVKVAGRAVIDVTMEDDFELLEETVVVGYGTKRKGSVAAAVSTINSEDIARTTSSTLSSALVGKVAGITSRQKSGVPGSSATLQIRNLGTPLYVIDGIIKDESQFNSLEPNDIENISVLKDGAAAIYGVRAANGVILVTTKSGSKNEGTTVELDFNYGWQAWTSYPKLLNAYEWVYSNYMMESNLGTLGVTPDVARAELEKWQSGYYNPETGEDYRGFDWTSYVSKAAPQRRYYGSVSGGSDKFTYYVSASHVNQDAVFKDYNYQRTNVQSNFSFDISENLRMGFRFSGNINKNTAPAVAGTDKYEAPRTALYVLAPIYRPYANDNENYLNNISGQSGYNLAAMTIETAGKAEKKTTVAQADWDLDWKTPVKGLTGKAVFSYSYSNAETDNFEKGWKEYSYDKATDTYNVVYDKSAAGVTYMERFNTRNTQYFGQALLNYDNTFGSHHVSGVAGFEFAETDYHALNLQQHPVENEFINIISTNENNTVSESKSNKSTASFIFRAGYDYKGRYIVDFSSRYDGSWKFPKGKRWGFFPSGSVAWRVSEEPFFRNSSVSSWFSNLKLRASYGMMGDDSLGSLYPDFSYLEGYNYYNGSALISSDPFNSSTSSKVIGSASKGIPITTISWMTVKMANVGLDFGFFGNKLSGEFDLFKRTRDGIPGTPSDLLFPLETGLSALPENLNSDSTMGLDMFIKWHDNYQDLKYNVGLNFTLARQKNGTRAGEIFYNAWDKYRWGKSDRWSNVVYNTDGGNYGGVWMWTAIGRFQTQEEIDNYPVDQDGQNNATVRPGDVILLDVNGDGIINDYDERPLGYASADWPGDSSTSNKNPLISVGLNIGLEWKGFDLSADIAGGFLNTFVADWYVKWGVTRSQNGYYYNNMNTWQHEDIFDLSSGWKEGLFPPLRGLSSHSGHWWNSFYSRSANYIRMRNLVFGYSLPSKWTRKAGIEQLRFYFEGTNLFYFYNSLRDYGFDPEISTVNGQDYPQHRVMSLGVSVKF